MTGESSRAGGGISYGHDTSQKGNPQTLQALIHYTANLTKNQAKLGMSKIHPLKLPASVLVQEAAFQKKSLNPLLKIKIQAGRAVLKIGTRATQDFKNHNLLVIVSKVIRMKDMKTGFGDLGQERSKKQDNFSQSKDSSNFSLGSQDSGSSYDNKQGSKSNQNQSSKFGQSDSSKQGSSDFNLGQKDQSSTSKSYSGGTHFDQPFGRDDLNDMKAGSDGSGSYNWSGKDQKFGSDSQQQKSQSSSSSGQQQQYSSGQQNQKQNHQGETLTHKVAENVSKVAEGVKDMAGTVGHKIMEGVHTVQEKLKDVVGSSSDQNKNKNK
eukprot:403350659